MKADRLISRIFLGLLIAFLTMLSTSEQASCASRQAKSQVKIVKKKKPATSVKKKSSVKIVGFRGWEYLVGKLKAEGISEAQLKSAYATKHMPIFEPVPFSVAPQESHAQYSNFFTEKNVDRAREFLQLHNKVFLSAHDRFTVEPSVIAAILLVETKFGKHTGKESVLVRLSRIVAATEAGNVEWNFRRLRALDQSVTLEQVRERAQYLDKTFFPELAALFEIARRRKISAHSIKGSIAGAFGIPQFLPKSYLLYGADGNGDRVISLFNPHDAIFSTAKFLSAKGWKTDAGLEQKRAAVWAYNRSTAYVDTVLQLATNLKPQ